MDGVLIDLLNAKWNTFVKKKFYKQFFTFAFYFLITLVCFTLRPGPPAKTQTAAPTTTNNTNSTLLHLNTTNSTNSSIIANESLKILTTVSPSKNTTDDDDDSDMEEWWDNLTDECRLMKLDTPLDQIRLAAEVFMLLGAFIYLAAAVREARFLGGRMFFENLVCVSIVVVFCLKYGKICR